MVEEAIWRNADTKHNVSVHIMLEMCQGPKITQYTHALNKITVKWWGTNSFLPHLLVTYAQEGTSHFHGQCWLFQSVCAHSQSPQTPTFLRCCQMLKSVQHWHPLSWQWQTPCIVNSYRLVFHLHRKNSLQCILHLKSKQYNNETVWIQKRYTHDKLRCL